MLPESCSQTQRLLLHACCRAEQGAQDKAVLDLAVVQEGLVRLVGGAALDLASTAGAGAGAARVWQVDAGLLCRVQDVGVICTRFPSEGVAVGSSPLAGEVCKAGRVLTVSWLLCRPSLGHLLVLLAVCS